MCGIAGLILNKTFPEMEQLEALVSALSHRGPDSAGYFSDKHLAFGMRRLSIIDVDSGRQPIFNEDNSLVIVFNGEIYNYLELRATLEAKGHVFSTRSDTEVIIHLYEEYGDEAPNHLRGMFCFAIWDKLKQELFIARDRFGIKPLFYFESEDGFYFSSEIKSFFSVPNFKYGLNCSAVADHFSLLFTDDVSTLYDGVRKLPPGHFLKLSGQNFKISRYYSIKPDFRIRSLGEGERRSLVKEALREAVKIHLLSEVPLGAYLSGGVDSSLLVALMKEQVGAGIKTFSVGFNSEGDAFDERKYANIVSRHLETEHHELILEPEMVSRSIEEILRALDEPFANASVIPNYFLAKFAREHVTVALSGLGGDEIAGGYERYRGMWLSERFPILGSLCSSSLVRSLVSAIPDSKNGFPMQERLKRFVDSASLPSAVRYFSFLSKFSASDRENLFSQRFLEKLATERESSSDKDMPWQERMQRWCVELCKEAGNVSAIGASSYVDLHTYIVEDLLALSDRTSMAHSLELRVPFIDHVLAELFMGLPDSDKISLFETKVLLKSIAAEFLPREVIYRRKQGFSVPINLWFRTSLKPFLLDVLSHDTIASQDIFNPAYVQKLLDEHFEGKRNHDEKLFSIMAFVYWLKEQGVAQ